MDSLAASGRACRQGLAPVLRGVAARAEHEVGLDRARRAHLAACRRHLAAWPPPRGVPLPSAPRGCAARRGAAARGERSGGSTGWPMTIGPRLGSSPMTVLAMPAGGNEGGRLAGCSARGRASPWARRGSLAAGVAAAMLGRVRLRAGVWLRFARAAEGRPHWTARGVGLLCPACS